MRAAADICKYLLLPTGQSGKVAASLLVAMSVIAFSCGDPKSRGDSDASYSFDPVLRGATKSTLAPGTALAPQGLSAAGEPGKIRLKWTFPPFFVYKGAKIGVRVYRKRNPAEGSQGFNFEREISGDWKTEIARATTEKLCDQSGSCSYVDTIGSGAYGSYALITFLDVADGEVGRQGSSPRSEPALAAGTALFNLDGYDYTGIADAEPNSIYGTVASPTDHAPAPGNHDFASALPGDLGRTVMPVTASGFDNLFGGFATGGGGEAVLSAWGAPHWLWSSREPMSAMTTSEQAWRSRSNPITAGLYRPNALSFILPDPGFHRAFTYSRGNDAVCAGLTAAMRPYCLFALFARPFSAISSLGQRGSFTAFPRNSTTITTTSGSIDGLSASREFMGRSMKVVVAPSGRRYILAFDRQRILVRQGEIFGCDVDPGESGDPVAGIGAEGNCGFQWSIGTYSPRQTCSRSARLDVTPGFAAPEGETPWTIVSGETVCRPEDDAYSMADGTPPTSYSLRLPMDAISVDGHLLIADTGNARVVRLPDFESALETCGKLQNLGAAHVSPDILGRPGSPSPLVSKPQGLCQFDMVLSGAKVASRGDVSIMEQRICLRGGETGGRMGPVSTPSSAFTNPLAGHRTVVTPAGTAGASPESAPAQTADQGGGEACRMDVFSDATGKMVSAAPGGYGVGAPSGLPSGTVVPVVAPGSNEVFRWRRASDYSDSTRSDISAATGLLSTSSRRTFRAPTSLGVDGRGRLYVLDAGYTRVRASSSSTEYALPSRLMIWVRNPLTAKICPEGSPSGTGVDQCSYNSDGDCVGGACSTRQCFAEECNASIIHGQPSPVQAFGIPSSVADTTALGDTLETSPDGFIPMAAFAVSPRSKGSKNPDGTPIEDGPEGVFIATGRDNTVIHLKNPTNPSNPEEVRMNVRTGSSQENLRTKNGAFAGIMLDETAGSLTLWDTRWNIGVTWTATPVSGEPAAVPTVTP